jgi:hypothetical protein
MSKGRVWNRGKHNGAGLSKKDTAGKESAGSTDPAELNAEEIPNPRIDTVKPMNRDNWVVRPARVLNKEPRNKAPKSGDEGKE